MIAFGVMLGLAGVIMLIAAAILYFRKLSFSTASEPVTAELLSKHSRNGKNGKVYELRVTYSVNGVEYKKYLRTSLVEFERLAEGDPLELLYKPRNPRSVLRPDAMDSRSIRVVLLVGVGLTLAGAVLYFIGQI